MHSDLERLVLGTAQIGMPYGIANTYGRQNVASAFEILHAAARAGVTVLDTAQQYGNSEEIIGAYLQRHSETNFRVITKIDPALDPTDSSGIIASVERSRSRIGRRLEGVLVHNPSWLLQWHRGVESALDHCLDQGTISSYGVSLYSPEEFDAAVKMDGISLIQFPFNVWDRRILASGLVERALEKEKSLFVRSVYLQGLLVMPAADALSKVPEAREFLQRWHSLCVKHKINPAQTALQYVRSAIPAAFVIVGCERPEQVSENGGWFSLTLSEAIIEEINSWPLPPRNVINPSEWATIQRV